MLRPLEGGNQGFRVGETKGFGSVKLKMQEVAAVGPTDTPQSGSRAMA